MAIVNELVTLLGFKMDDKDLERAQAGVKSLRKSVMALSVAAAAAMSVWGVFVRGVAADAQKLQTVSDKTGLSTTALQEWAYAASVMGASASAVTGDLAAIAQQAAFTGRSVEDFADMFKGMGVHEANLMGAGFGISSDTVLLLRQGRDGIAALRQEARSLGAVLPDESIRQAAAFKTSIDQISFALRGMVSQVVVGVLPSLHNSTNVFKGWLAQNREFLKLKMQQVVEGISGGFRRFFEIIRKVGNFFKPVVDIFKSFTGALNESDVLSRLVTGALLGLGLILAPLALKFAIIAGVIMLAALAIEDFLGWLDGSDSIIGRFINGAKVIFKSVNEWAEDLVLAMDKAINDFIERIKRAIKESAIGSLIWGDDEAEASAVQKKVREYSDSEIAGMGGVMHIPLGQAVREQREQNIILNQVNHFKTSDPVLAATHLTDKTRNLLAATHTAQASN